MRQLWSCQDRLDVSERSVQPPAGRRDQHLSEEAVVSRTSGTDADRHTGRLPQPRPLADRLAGPGYRADGTALHLRPANIPRVVVGVVSVVPRDVSGSLLTPTGVH